MSRGPDAYRHGDFVIVPARIANLLRRHANLTDLRLRAKAFDPEFYDVLTALHRSALEWLGSEIGPDSAAHPEPATPLKEWYSSREAAGILRVGDRAVRKALELGRLEGQLIDGRWRIGREAIVNYQHALRKR
ncbi:MAG: binding domain protein excisionase family [Planctomycetaceae bacterium]|nr:binding domain protein excisionase family [Planctomycetaceae bacterium]